MGSTCGVLSIRLDQISNSSKHFISPGCLKKTSLIFLLGGYDSINVHESMYVTACATISKPVLSVVQKSKNHNRTTNSIALNSTG